MEPLIDLLQKTRDWSQATRGTDLIARAKRVFADHLSIDAGMFLYARRMIPDQMGHLDTSVRVFSPWGFEDSIEQLEELMTSEMGHDVQQGIRLTESWRDISQLNAPWRSLFQRTGLIDYGIWPIMEGDHPVGYIVLGRRKSVSNAALISVCATQLSLVGELLFQRRKAEDVSRRDALTGVLNRRGLDVFLPSLHAERNTTLQRLFFGLLDVDNFKRVNDELGHVEGDKVLVDIAQTLVQIVTGHGIVGRIGGDEFVFCVLSSELEPSDVQTWIRQAFENKVYCVCVGVTEWQDETDWYDLIAKADTHLYRLKRQER